VNRAAVLLAAILASAPLLAQAPKVQPPKVQPPPAQPPPAPRPPAEPSSPQPTSTTTSPAQLKAAIANLGKFDGGEGRTARAVGTGRSSADRGRFEQH